MLENRFTVNDGTTDYTAELADFTGREVSISITTGNYLNLGFYKKINQVYFYVTTGNPTETTMTVEKYVDGSWESVKMLDDKTYGMFESGLIKWQEADNDDKQQEQTILSETGYFYRISFSANITATVKGAGIIFADDKDVYLEEPILDNDKYRKHVVKTNDDYMNIHLSTKREIIQEIRNKAIVKYRDEDEDGRLKFFRNITEFDLFDLDEVRQAATLLSIANIFYKLSDTPDDAWETKGNRYQNRYHKALNIAFISLDRDDDGELESHENLKSIQPLRMSR